MRSTVLLIAFSVAAAAELPPRADASKNASRLLRSSASTLSLPRFPEEPLRSHLRDEPAPQRPTRIITIGRVVESVADNRFRISIGRDDGFKVGHELDVYRDEKKIARIVIRELDKIAAVAEALPPTVVEKPRQGDSLRFNTADAQR